MLNFLPTAPIHSNTTGKLQSKQMMSPPLSPEVWQCLVPFSASRGNWNGNQIFSLRCSSLCWWLHPYHPIHAHLSSPATDKVTMVCIVPTSMPGIYLGVTRSSKSKHIESNTNPLSFKIHFSACSTCMLKTCLMPICQTHYNF